jgi:hypothetical protein
LSNFPSPSVTSVTISHIHHCFREAIKAIPTNVIKTFTIRITLHTILHKFTAEPESLVIQTLVNPAVAVFRCTTKIRGDGGGIIKQDFKNKRRMNLSEKPGVWHIHFLQEKASY